MSDQVELYIIKNIEPTSDNYQLYWSNAIGWCSLRYATIFTAFDTFRLNLPLEGRWETLLLDGRMELLDRIVELEKFLHRVSQEWDDHSCESEAACASALMDLAEEADNILARMMHHETGTS